MASIYNWSKTAADNGSSDSGVCPWPEGMPRKQVNDSARGMMRRLAEYRDDLGGSLSAGGTADGLTVTANSAFTSYADGLILSFRATATNTGAATLNVNGLGAKAIRKMSAGGDAALVAGEIQDTGIYIVQYSTALNGAAGAWLLVNSPLAGEGSFTPTLRGTSTTGSGTYTTQQGKYTKIGRLVFLDIMFVWTAHSGTGNMFVASLPFSADSSQTYPVTIALNNVTFSGTPAAIVSGVSIDLYTMSSGAALSPIAMDTAGTLRLSGMYLAA